MQELALIMPLKDAYLLYGLDPAIINNLTVSTR